MSSRGSAYHFVTSKAVASEVHTNEQNDKSHVVNGQYRDLMVKNLKRAKKMLEKEGRACDYDFFPQTYVLPLEHGIFVEEFRRNPGEHHKPSC